MHARGACAGPTALPLRTACAQPRRKLSLGRTQPRRRPDQGLLREAVHACTRSADMLKAGVSTGGLPDSRVPAALALACASAGQAARDAVLLDRNTDVRKFLVLARGAKRHQLIPQVVEQDTAGNLRRQAELLLFVELDQVDGVRHAGGMQGKHDGAGKDCEAYSSSRGHDGPHQRKPSSHVVVSSVDSPRRQQAACC